MGESGEHKLEARNGQLFGGLWQSIYGEARFWGGGMTIMANIINGKLTGVVQFMWSSKNSSLLQWFLFGKFEFNS